LIKEFIEWRFKFKAYSHKIINLETKILNQVLLHTLGKSSCYCQWSCIFRIFSGIFLCENMKKSCFKSGSLKGERLVFGELIELIFFSSVHKVIFNIICHLINWINAYDRACKKGSVQSLTNRKSLDRGWMRNKMKGGEWTRVRLLGIFFFLNFSEFVGNWNEYKENFSRINFFKIKILIQPALLQIGSARIFVGRLGCKKF